MWPPARELLHVHHDQDDSEESRDDDGDSDQDIVDELEYEPVNLQ